MASALLPPGIDPSQVGLGQPPAGVVPNLVDPPSSAWGVRASVYASLPPMLLFLALRLHVRVRARMLGLDDYVALAAAVCNVAYCGVCLAMYLDDVRGRHTWEFPLSEYTVEYVQLLMASVCVFDLCAIFTKTSLLLLYMRIFKVARAAAVMIWMGILFTVLFYVVCFIAIGVFCFPREGEDWFSASLSPRCGPPQQKLAAVQGVVGVMTDFYTLAIPFFLVLRLQMSTSKKTAVAGIFLTGLMACAFSIAGTVARFQSLLAVPQDYTWKAVASQSFAIAEVNVGLMCCSLPVIFVLFRSLRPLSESAWSSVRDWLRARSAGSQDPSKISSGKAYHINFNENPDKSNREELPQVPKGTLSGLMSFVRKGARSEYRSRLDHTTINQRTESHVELASIDDYHYHTYLNDRSVGVGRSSDSAYRPA